MSMEDYDTFVLHRLSQLRKRGEEDENARASPASSLIRVHGRAILPPLLSKEQREEMRGLRDAAQKAAGCRKSRDDPRLACVQSILQSVQLRKIPTLEELLQESDTITESLYSLNSSGGSVSKCNSLSGSQESLSLSPATVRTGKEDFTFSQVPPALPSAISNASHQQSYNDSFLADQCESQQGPEPSSPHGGAHQSLSSGYLTYENVDSTICVSEVIDAGSESRGFGSPDDGHSMDSPFLLNTTNTITKMPEIISHPPIDGEVLEKSGLESSYFDNFKAVKYISCTSFHEESFISDFLTAEKSENSLVETTERGDKDHTLDRREEPVSSSENSVISLITESSDTSSTHQDPITHLHNQHKPIDAEPVDNRLDEAKLSEEPHRLSLQALLKKSQEYRRRQRMLRNQAKNSKLQERPPEPKTRPEEQSLSDKENDSTSCKAAEGKKTAETRGTLNSTVEMLLKTSWENEGLIESEFTGVKSNNKFDSCQLNGDICNKKMAKSEEETTFENNKLNSLPEVIVEPKKASAFIPQLSVSTEASPEQEAFYTTAEQGNIYQPDIFQSTEKYYTMPAPTFCMSPVYTKSRCSIIVGKQSDAVQTPVSIDVVNTALKDDKGIEEKSNQTQHNSHAEVHADVSSVLAKSSGHIYQLESSLSSLKVLISDLELTVKENLENRSQIESDTPSECSFIAEHYKNDHGDHLENMLTNDEAESGHCECMDLQQIHSSENGENIHEDRGAEANISDVHNAKEETVHLAELALVKTLATERMRENRTDKERFMKSSRLNGISTEQHAPSKSILSAAQWMRVPDVFRTTRPGVTAPRNESVLSDNSYLTVKKINETPDPRGRDSARSPSLNQSYNVESPSGLWFLEDSGPSLNSKEQEVRKNQLTPESGGEGHGGVSKVKRRLLMPVSGETKGRTDSRTGVGYGVRPSSVTPKGHSCPNNKVEQLKQAHAAKIRALQEEHRKQEEELLQALAARYHLLQSVSFPCTTSSSRLGDTLTFPALSQLTSPMPERYRPLLLAAIKGFLTRRLLRTERVVQLVRTIRDSQQVLRALQQQQQQQQFRSRQDLLLEERVTQQLVAVRYNLYDIFFNLSTAERMRLISWDRDLSLERVRRRQSGHPKGKSCLSSATQKSLGRKRGIITQKMAAERNREVVTKTACSARLSPEQPLETKRGQFRANPQRVPKSTYSTRPR